MTCELLMELYGGLALEETDEHRDAVLGRNTEHHVDMVRAGSTLDYERFLLARKYPEQFPEPFSYEAVQ